MKVGIVDNIIFSNIFVRRKILSNFVHSQKVYNEELLSLFSIYAAIFEMSYWILVIISS